MTTEGDPAAAELKDSFFLFSSSLADGGMNVFFFNFQFLSLTPSAYPCE